MASKRSRQSRTQRQFGTSILQTGADPSPIHVEGGPSGQRRVYQPPRSDPARRPLQITIALDMGMGNIKAAYLIKRASDPERLRLFQQDFHVYGRVDEVVWEGSYTRCPAQLAYVVRGSAAAEQIWGWEVESELDTPNLGQDRILKWLKATMFDDGPKARTYHQNKLRDRLRNLKEEGLLDQDVQIKTLWTDLLKHAYNFALDRIKKDNSDIAPYLEASQGTQPVEIQVVFPHPASASIDAIQTLLETAADAGIPNAQVVAEPVAAVVAAAQEDFENRRSNRDSSNVVTAVVDTGAGTVDVMAVILKRERSEAGAISNGDIWQVHELVPGETEWNGGSFVDEEFRILFQRLYKLDTRIAEMQAAVPHITIDLVLDELQKQFEKKKRSFNGVEQTYRPITLHFQGLLDDDKPWITVNDGMIQLDLEFMKECFKPVIKATKSLLERLIGKVEAMDLELRKIILTGGANENEYVRSTIVRKFETSRGYHVEIERKANKASLRTVVGAALIRMDRTFLTQRRVRRGYFIKWTSIVEGNHRQYDKSKIWWDTTCNECRWHDRALCLLMIDEVVSEGFTRYVSEFHKGKFPYRDLYFESRSSRGFDIEEEVFHTDDSRLCADGLGAECDPTTKAGFKIATKLRFVISNDDCRRFPTLLDFASPPNQYIRFQYDVGLRIERGCMRFFVVVPRSGKFGPLDNDHLDPAKVISIDAVVNSTGVLSEMMGK